MQMQSRFIYLSHTKVLARGGLFLSLCLAAFFSYARGEKASQALRAEPDTSPGMSFTYLIYIHRIE